MRRISPFLPPSCRTRTASLVRIKDAPDNMHLLSGLTFQTGSIWQISLFGQISAQNLRNQSVRILIRSQGTWKGPESLPGLTVFIWEREGDRWLSLSESRYAHFRNGGNQTYQTYVGPSRSQQVWVMSIHLTTLCSLPPRPINGVQKACQRKGFL